LSQKSPSYKYWIPAIFWAALIFFLSSLSQEALPKLGIEYEDLAVHFAVYLVLGYLLAVGLMQPAGRRTLEMSIIAVVLGALYGASDEFHQMFVPGRFSAVSDFIADGLGALAGVAAFWWFKRPAALIQKSLRLPA